MKPTDAKKVRDLGDRKSHRLRQIKLNVALDTWHMTLPEI
jgi:hypothetical protein